MSKNYSESIKQPSCETELWSFVSLKALKEYGVLCGNLTWACTKGRVLNGTNQSHILVCVISWCLALAAIVCTGPGRIHL